MSDVIELRDLKSKGRTFRGKKYPPSNEPGCEFNADVTPGVKVRIFGIHNRRDFDLTFFINTIAVHGSFNLIYTGKIVKISENSITIFGHGKNERQDYYTFIRRNWNYDPDEIEAHNREASMSI